MTTTATQVITIACDGACSGNPGPGGYGVIIVKDGEHQVLGGYEANTTNNRMELQAILVALQTVPGDCRIITDSSYAVDCIIDWSKHWIRIEALRPTVGMDVDSGNIPQSVRLL